MKKLGKYEIIKEIGRGGFGVVYQARDTRLDRLVALKVLHAHLLIDPTFVQRFQREAKLAAQFHHPNIVSVFDVDEIDGQHFMAMAYLDGQPLTELLAKGPLPVERALTSIRQIAAALDAIHARKLVHRDVKSANIMLTPDEWTVLLDFGLVRAAEGTKLTQTGLSLGTFEYIAPEQIEQRSDLDGRADQYALGIVAYELLTGRLPFTGPVHSLIYQHMHQPPPSPRLINPQLPAALEPPLLRALAKDPAERYPSSGVLASALIQALQPVQPSPKLTLAKPALLQPPVSPAGNARVWEKDGKVVVRIPAGEFLYRDGIYYWFDDDKSDKKKSLPEFWIDKTPVTNAEYARFVAATGHKPPKHWDGHRPPDRLANHPVVYVSWFDANAYATWAGKRLPTQEEWEKAARGIDGRKYPWGNEAPTKNLCNFGHNEKGTTPVGKYSPQGDSPYGCVDMSGNVWEWTSSDGHYGKVLRGGSWRADVSFVYAAYRVNFAPRECYGIYGFRCAAPPGNNNE